jgi:RNA binding exosome subunit
VTFSAVRFRALCHATEDEAKVRAALEFVTGGAPVAVSATKGHHGNRIAVLESELSRGKEIGALWRRLSEAGVAGELLERLDSALGDDLWLGLRLDKQEAFLGRLAFDKGGDVVHVRARVAAYPATRENALKVVERYFRK